MKGKDGEHTVAFSWETEDWREVPWRDIVYLNKGKSVALGSAFFLWPLYGMHVKS